MKHSLKTQLMGLLVCLASCLVGVTAAKLVDTITTEFAGRASSPQLDKSVLIVDGNRDAPIQVTRVRFAAAGPPSDILVDVTNTTDRDAKFILFIVVPSTESSFGYPFVG